MSVQRSVLVLQPYLPEYRRPFFDRVADRLGDDGVRLDLVVGRPGGRQAARGDESIPPPYARTVRTWRLSAGRRSVRWKPVSTRGADLVVSELGSGVLENYVLGAARPTQFVVFGHGYAAVSRPNVVDGALERWQMRRAAHLFAYTDRGRDAMLRAGAAAERVTVVGNTLDTSRLEQEVSIVSADRRAGVRAELGIGVNSPVALFVGALDGSKRLDLLFAVAELVARRIPDFVLLVAGDGSARSTVERTATRSPWLRYVGRVDDRRKAQLGAISSILLNPGRVGLVAVDSFVLGLPIVTTDWDLHAPEFDYLEHGRTAVVADDDARSVAAAVTELLLDGDRLALMSAACRSELDHHRIDGMVDRFCDGVLRALGDRPGRRP